MFGGLFTRQRKMKDDFEVLLPSPPPSDKEEDQTPNTIVDGLLHDDDVDTTSEVVHPVVLPEKTHEEKEDVPDKFKHIVNGVYSPPNAFYTQVSLTDEDIKYIGLIIGRSGFYFKKITQAARVDYIWYDPDRKAIEIWGSERRLLNAVNRVHARIHRVRKEIAAKQHEEHAPIPST
jgi:hypothetical protein